MYCSVSDVRDGIPEATSEYVSDATIVRFIRYAEGEIDALLRKLYTVPFTAGSIPTVISELCTDLAVIRTMSTFPDRNFDDDLTRLILRTDKRKNELAVGDLYLGTEFDIENSRLTGGYFYSDTSQLGDHISDDRGL